MLNISVCAYAYSYTVLFSFVYKFWLWCYQMETFSALLTICVGNSPVTGEFPAQRPVTRSFDTLFDPRLEETVE